ncbi:aminotransferase class III-fold pyridoxal phosphate-dependent enzyme [Acidisoma cellulosilytica]|uniref:Aminotransferase class III-fold pyridoxal phosphate-dependent enzyme n=1 Tax=Acidisoma cellulosilyticum TaxID=2802395 RepID=A0A963YZ02_9PROT|nr:aminotransferase [Acidisoma cellulosilyticum]MCB8879474.1 aminotransferase class III-fold pyridoxal phosphate-dependent enzyme [Acidisoma cellulosilyticum]
MLDIPNDIDHLRAVDNAHHFHPFTDHKSLHEGRVRVITRAEGVWIWDGDGHRMLDGMAGLWCVNAGYSQPSLVEAAARQMATLPYYNCFFNSTTPAVAALSERLARISPAGLNHVFYASSGSEAVDSALRIARQFWKLQGKPEKRIIVSREYGYHGSTIAGASVGGMKDMHKQAGDLPDFHQVMTPYTWRDAGDLSPEEFGLKAALSLETYIQQVGADKIAAFIGEPIQGAGGVIIPPDNYWPEIQRICRENDILLIADEVICGYGRLGSMFGSDVYGIQPDLMTTAKGITSGYVPLSALFVGDRVAETFIEQGGEFYHGFTYSGHPVACAVALANLDVIDSQNLVGAAERQGAKLLDGLRASLGDHPLVSEIRGKGLMIAMELAEDRAGHKAYPSARKVGLTCRNFATDEGLVMRACRDTMVLAPPLVISDEEVSLVVERATRAVDRTWAEVKAG